MIVFLNVTHVLQYYILFVVKNIELLYNKINIFNVGPLFAKYMVRQNTAIWKDMHDG